jgi:hypothetical protein
MCSPVGDATPDTAGATRAAIERFLNRSRQAALFEPGEERFLLTPGSYTLMSEGSRLLFQVWDDCRSLVRRVKGIASSRPGRLELAVEVFPKRTGKLVLVDLALAASSGVVLQEKRAYFRERVRELLSRQYPQWKISRLSSETDLEHSLSPRYVRALLTRGSSSLAALAAPPRDQAADAALTHGLIWLSHLRGQGIAAEGLALFLPLGQELSTCLRLRCMNERAARWRVHVYSPEWHAGRVDWKDHGNVDTRLETYSDYRSALGEQALRWIERLAANAAVEVIGGRDGSAALRVAGMEFARANHNGMQFGLARKVEAHEPDFMEIEGLVRELARMRCAGAVDKANPLYRAHPENWLESRVRKELAVLDASLQPFPVYGQVPAFAGGERGVIDLLAVDRGGRLAVVELKATADLHLPVQALDYWLRVQWHLERGEFSGRGYFPAVRLANQAPRLLLVAPALEFHPTTEEILRYFNPAIEVERIGLGVEWRRKLQVVFRVQGSRSPC